MAETADAPAPARSDILRIGAPDKSVFARGLIALTVLFGLWHVVTNVYLIEPGRWQNAIHFAGFAFLASVTVSPFGSRADARAAWIFDVIYGLIVAAAALWVAGAEDALYERSLAVTGQGWQLTVMDWAAGFILIFACIDLSRRVSGWVIPILVILSLSYILFLGTWMPGIFRAASLPLNDVMFRTLYNDEGLFGILASISSTNITLFMIFGGFLVVSGASHFVIELSKIVAGRIKGGAAFVAVLASALTGTISGSAVANTASTGVITIPLMKANGFRPQFAAGVEASASTGGQLMPPIMGAGAFVMASYTSIPYGTIVAVSVIPAILYFLSVAFIVRIEAVKYDAGSEIDLTVDRGKLLSGGLVFVIPLTVMIWLLLTGVTPSYAACWAIATLIVTSWVTSLLARVLPEGMFKPVVMGPSNIADAFVSGVRASIMTAVLLVTIGIMNNAIVTSGVGNGFSLMIAQWSQGSLVLAIALIALASLVLGMGLPVTAAYIILAILTAPALAGIMSDSLIVEQLMEGISDPSKSALFFLVEHPLTAKVTEGMTKAEAWELVAAIPFEVAVTIRPGPGGSGDCNDFPPDGASDHLLAEPGFERYAAGLPRGFRRRRDCRVASHGDRVRKLEDREGALHRAASLCLHAPDFGRVPGGDPDRFLRALRDIRHQCPDPGLQRRPGRPGGNRGLRDRWGTGLLAAGIRGQPRRGSAGDLRRGQVAVTATG